MAATMLFVRLKASKSKFVLETSSEKLIKSWLVLSSFDELAPRYADLSKPHVSWKNNRELDAILHSHLTGSSQLRLTCLSPGGGGDDRRVDAGCWTALVPVGWRWEGRRGRGVDRTDEIILFEFQISIFVVVEKELVVVMLLLLAAWSGGSGHSWILLRVSRRKERKRSFGHKSPGLIIEKLWRVGQILDRFSWAYFGCGLFTLAKTNGRMIARYWFRSTRRWLRDG